MREGENELKYGLNMKIHYTPISIIVLFKG